MTGFGDGAQAGRGSWGMPRRYTTKDEVESLGISLGPALHDACGDRLGDIEWFRSPWQRSGAATGKTWWRLPDGRVIDAIAKVPVSYTEYFWTTRLGEVDPMWWDSDACRHLPVPRVLASGVELGGYDVAWIVVERVAGSSVSGSFEREHFERLFEATAVFHKLALEVRPPQEATRRPEPEWDKTLASAVAACEVNAIDNADEWMLMIGRVRDGLDRLLALWNQRPMETWCHGDLHPGNVIIRVDEQDPGDRQGVLIDFSHVHPGHWVEDALYIERLHWGHELMLRGVEPVPQLAAQRRAHGLTADLHDDEIADVRRVLMAATSPAFLGQEGDRAYLAAALQKLRGITPCFGIC